MATLFISASLLRENTPIDNNVDEKLLTPIILYCQRDYIRWTIGSDLYNELVSQIEASTVTALNQTLIEDYIHPSLKWYCVSELAIAGHIKFKNKGLVLQSSENSQPVDFKDAFKVYNFYKDRAELDRERLRKYLVANEASYPKYIRDVSTGEDTIHANKNSYSTGMNLWDDSKPDKNKWGMVDGYCNEC